MAVQSGNIAGELAYVTSMVRKDVLRTDRLHPFYAGSDENQNIAALFNILTTYALNHPDVSYCQGMSDIASPLLVIMNDEPQAYICFCSIMLRLKSNFLVDGIAMTQKFAHLAEALEHYDPEFYAYLKMHQADDLLFCYRWLLLEMKREFAFDDALMMLEVLWSSLPSTSPELELPLYDKLFEVPVVLEVPVATTVTPLKSPSVVMRPRESNYTKVCELRRQSSALSLYSNVSMSSSTNPISSQSNQMPTKLDTTKRMNQSLDENLSRERLKNYRKTHLSLDETEMMLLKKQQAVVEDDTKPKSTENIISSVEIHNNLELTKDTNPFLSPGNSSVESMSPVSPVRNPLLLRNRAGSPLKTKKYTGSHFKDLKDRIAAGKKGIMVSADRIDVDTSGGDEPKVKLVKNFNEFLNFSAMNKSRIADKTTNTKVLGLELEKDKNGHVEQTPGKRHLKLTNDLDAIECQNEKLSTPSPDDMIINEEDVDKSSSPDNSEYFPMTTSKTRELRLQLESLDRQVFGSDFHQQKFCSLTSNTSATTTTTTTDTPPESADSLSAQSESSMFFLTDINYTKLQQNPMEIQEMSAVTSAMVATMPKIRHHANKNRSVDNLKRISVNNDVFVWENPLHSLESCDDLEKSAMTTATIETMGRVKTPDEQLDIEYDGEIMEETSQGEL
jgi:TBC1 domain family member 25